MENPLHPNSDLTCITRIKAAYSSLRKAERKAADQILSSQEPEEREQLLNMSILELADKASVSEASVIRFCKQLGYSGFSELKLRLAQEWGSSWERERAVRDLHITSADKAEELPEKVIGRTIRALEDTSKIIDKEQYMKAVRAIAAAKSVDIYGVGTSFAVALDLVSKLVKLGIRCQAYADSHIQIMTALSLDPDCVAIGISHSGRTRETVEALRTAGETGATAICITNSLASPITEAADIKLLTACYETDFFSETMVSRISQLAIIDMIYLGILLLDYDKYIGRVSRANLSQRDKAL